jgi:hypothetical protein
MAVDEAEGPVLDEMAAGEPLVGPGKDEGAGRAHGESAANLPGKNARLLRLAFAHGVDAELRQHQRAVDREIVEAREIAAERPLLMQIDVEAEEIGEVDGQILGRGKVRVADETVGMDLLDRRHQPLEKAAHALGTMPAHDVGRDLVADEIGKKSAVPVEAAHRVGDAADDVGLEKRIIEEGDVLRPGNAGQHLETRLGGSVEEGERRRSKNAHRVGAHLPHHPEVLRHRLVVRELRSIGAQRKGSVGHAFDEELFVARKKELALHPDRRRVRGRAGLLAWHDGGVDRLHDAMNSRDVWTGAVRPTAAAARAAPKLRGPCLGRR